MRIGHVAVLCLVMAVSGCRGSGDADRIAPAVDPELLESLVQDQIPIGTPLEDAETTLRWNGFQKVAESEGPKQAPINPWSGPAPIPQTPGDGSRPLAVYFRNDPAGTRFVTRKTTVLVYHDLGKVVEVDVSTGFIGF